MNNLPAFLGEGGSQRQKYSKNTSPIGVEDKVLAFNWLSLWLVEQQ